MNEGPLPLSLRTNINPTRPSYDILATERGISHLHLLRLSSMAAGSRSGQHALVMKSVRSRPKHLGPVELGWICGRDFRCATNRRSARQLFWASYEPKAVVLTVAMWRRPVPNFGSPLWPSGLTKTAHSSAFELAHFPCVTTRLLYAIDHTSRMLYSVCANTNPHYYIIPYHTISYPPRPPSGHTANLEIQFMTTSECT